MFGITNPNAHKKQHERTKEEIERALKKELQEVGYKLEDFKKEVNKGVPAIIFYDEKGYYTESLSNIPFNMIQKHSMTNIGSYDALVDYPYTMYDIAWTQVAAMKQSVGQYIINTVLENLQIWLASSIHIHYYCELARVIYPDPSGATNNGQKEHRTASRIVDNVRESLKNTGIDLGAIFNMATFKRVKLDSTLMDSEGYTNRRLQLINNMINPCIVEFANVIVTEIYKKVQSDGLFYFSNGQYKLGDRVIEKVNKINACTQAFYGEYYEEAMLNIKDEYISNFRAYNCFMRAFASDLYDFLYNTVGVILYNVYDNAWKTGYFFIQDDLQNHKDTEEDDVTIPMMESRI